MFLRRSWVWSAVCREGAGATGVPDLLKKWVRDVYLTVLCVALFRALLCERSSDNAAVVTQRQQENNHNWRVVMSDGDRNLFSLFSVFVPSMLSFSHVLFALQAFWSAFLGEWCHLPPPAVSVVVFSCLCDWWCCCVWQEQRLRWDLGFERHRSPNHCRSLRMWPFAVAVLPCQTGAGDRWPLTLTVSTAVRVVPRACGWGAVAAAVGVHPS